MSTRATLKELIKTMDACSAGKTQVSAIINEILTSLTGRGLDYVSPVTAANGNIFAYKQSLYIKPSGIANCLINLFTGEAMRTLTDSVQLLEQNHQIKFVAKSLTELASNLKTV